MDKKREGFKNYRFENNPLEKQLHDNFIKHVERNSDSNKAMSSIVYGSKDRGINPTTFLSEYEEQIVISTIQWLGSPVGKNFLRENGFIKQ